MVLCIFALHLQLLCVRACFGGRLNCQRTEHIKIELINFLSTHIYNGQKFKLKLTLNVVYIQRVNVQLYKFVLSSSVWILQSILQADTDFPSIFCVIL